MEKRLLLFLFAVLTTVSTWAYYDFEVDGIYYYRRTETTVAVSRSGSGSYSGDVVIPSSVTYEGTTYSVTEIQFESFSGCSGLTSVVIPSSVTWIGYSAFSGCSSLTSVEIPSSVTSIDNGAFSGCSGLTSVVISSSETSITDGTFSGCSGLTSVVIPSSVTSIGNWAFEGCSSLTSVDIPSSVTSIYGGAFSGCSGLTSVEIPSRVTEIGDGAFSGCSGLTSITIPPSVTSIGGGAFEGCDNLTFNTHFNAKYLGNKDNPYLALIEATSKEITQCKVSSETKLICSDAFKNCNILTSVDIPSSVISIGSSAFSGCNITRIDYTGTLEEWCNKQWNLNYISSSYDLYINGNKVEEVKIPSSVTSVGYRVFSGCRSLTSVEIPSSVTKIGNYAFSGCSGLTSVEIPSSVTSIGSYAFSRCIGLTSVEIPSSVTSIGVRVFEGCDKFTYNTYFNAKYLGNEDNPYLVLIEASSKEITECKVSSGTKLICSAAFKNCNILTSVDIPSSVISIGSSAFSGCNITRIDYTGTLEEWCNKQWNPSYISSSYDLYINGNKVEEVKIPSRVTSIGDYAFSGCSSLTSVEIPSSVTQIGNYAFSGCSGLTSITIPPSVTSIGGGAFEGCDNLTYNEYDNGLYLGKSENPYLCLVKAKSLEITSVKINDKTSIIAYDAFFDCSGLRSVEIPSSVTEIGSSAFWGCSGLRSVEIPSSVTEIGGSAFSRCSGLRSVEIPSSVTSIGDRAFSECSGLSSVVIPSSVTEIGYGAFSYCSGLSLVVIPSSVTEIGDYAFSRCQNLRSVRIEAENPPSMSVKSAFEYSPINAIYIPDGTTEAYKTALGTWEDGTYPNYIEFGKLPELENTSGGNAIVVAVDGNEVTLDIKLDKGFTLGQIIVNGLVVYPTINKALMPVTVTDLGGGKYLVSGVTNADYIKVVYSDGNDTPTAIENITILRPVREGIYNLQGQKLTAPQRGINIIDGKKVIVR
ncbi:MAG: leucine-rich repeat domain-containing protein [Bacteroidales bacterium]|nr:leucine-rich repeat domain-containing protein [Bacteroidales bacterium]